jgi:hypothetical protein
LFVRLHDASDGVSGEQVRIQDRLTAMKCHGDL